VRQTAEQLQRQLSNIGSASGPRSNGKLPAGDLPGVLLASAFPDRIGQRRDGEGGRYLLSGGRGALFRDPTSLARSDFIVVAALDDRDREARIQLAAPLSRESLLHFADERITQTQEIHWDARNECVVARRTLRLDALLLDEKPLADIPPDQAQAAMLEGVRQLGLAALPWDDEARNLQSRLEFVRALPRAEATDWPASDDASLLATLDHWLMPWLAGVTRRAHLQRISMTEALVTQLTHAQRLQLNTLAPRELRVPSGSSIRIDYLDDNAPCIAVRLHEVFGLADTPRIGGGVVPITFKLLSPAQRPVQITKDLAGFWRTSYIEVRKEMRGRYPRHHWPENPLEAAPTTRSLKRPPRR
jgi:ATP-dependent helicase HrpB